MLLSHQSLIGFLGPQGPYLEETQGLFTSITLLEQEQKSNKEIVIKRYFFMNMQEKN
jgi:hypothetical protein